MWVEYFLIDEVYDYGSKEAEAIHTHIIKTISPKLVVTCPKKDTTFSRKQKQLKSLGVNLVQYMESQSFSSTSILERIITMEKLG